MVRGEITWQRRRSPAPGGSLNFEVRDAAAEDLMQDTAGKKINKNCLKIKYSSLSAFTKATF